MGVVDFEFIYMICHSYFVLEQKKSLVEPANEYDNRYELYPYMMNMAYMQNI